MPTAYMGIITSERVALHLYQGQLHGQQPEPAKHKFKNQENQPWE